jgi:hypothetical protein
MFSELDLCSCKEEFANDETQITGFIALAALSVLLPGVITRQYKRQPQRQHQRERECRDDADARSRQCNTNTRRAPTREEYERDKERYNREAKESGRTVGTGINDGWLW